MPGHVNKRALGGGVNILYPSGSWEGDSMRGDPGARVYSSWNTNDAWDVAGAEIR